MTSTTYRRATAFDSIEDILDWSESHGSKPPVVERGSDGMCRGSVEVEGDEKGDLENARTSV